MAGPRASLFGIAAFGILISAASAADPAPLFTVTYAYDALGRVTTVVYSGGVNGGSFVKYKYDAAGNRTQYVVQKAVQRKVIVLPLFGYTVVRLPP